MYVDELWEVEEFEVENHGYAFFSKEGLENEE
jgi:hypothetical protein